MGQRYLWIHKGRKKIDISSATLDVIEAVKTRRSVQFDYGHDVIREIKPTAFFGDFDGFEGTDEDTEEKEFRRFRFDKIEEWLGIPIQYKVYVELDMSGYPTDKEVAEKLHELLDSAEPIMYTLKPQGDL